jgi:hypothetical protein
LILRTKINSEIGDTWRKLVITQNKSDLKKLLLENPDLIDDLFKSYAAKKPQYYDFSEDKAGEYKWLSDAIKITREHKLPLTLPVSPCTEDVENLVEKICLKFKDLIENNGLCALLYDSTGKVKNESASQLIFYGVADAYCKASEILLARESDAGRGPVDFKFGTNMENSVLVEIKKSTNISGLQKGITKQLPEYMKAEGAKSAIYLVIDVGTTKAATKKLNSINQMINGKKIKIIHVDGFLKPSASKL